VSWTQTLDFEALEQGAPLPPLQVPVTTKGIVAGALATRDFQDVHHDAERARALGSPDIFMNILTTNGLVERYVTQWAGPGARLKSVAIRLGAPNYPGDTMIFSGEVTARDAILRVLTVSVNGKNSRGVHVSATVKLHFPEDGR
jgi:acyl dehydratase